MAKRFEVYLVPLDPTVGSEIKKTRPCVIVSPDEINLYIHTVIVAPLTSADKDYAYRVSLTFQNRKGQIALDQIRAVDKSRLGKKLGSLSSETSRAACTRLMEMFSY